jgi:hypothetical protein
MARARFPALRRVGIHHAHKNALLDDLDLLLKAKGVHIPVPADRRIPDRQFDMMHAADPRTALRSLLHRFRVRMHVRLLGWTVLPYCCPAIPRETNSLSPRASGH